MLRGRFQGAKRYRFGQQKALFLVIRLHYQNLALVQPRSSAVKFLTLFNLRGMIYSRLSSGGTSSSKKEQGELSWGRA